MSQKSLKTITEKTLKVGKANLTYVLLDDNQVYFSQKSFNQYIGLTDKKNKAILYQDKDSIYFQNKNGDPDVGLPMEKAIVLCSSKIEEMVKGNNDVNLLFKCLSLLTVLSEIGIQALISGIKIKESLQNSEPESGEDVKFDDLLAGLMRVPPPKKSK